jgi:mono/diheme cytochrome c family protein
LERSGAPVNDKTVVIFIMLLGGFLWVVTWLPTLSLRQTTSDWIVPAAFAELESPIPITDEGQQRAREQYLLTCAKCHGFLAQGDGPQYQILIPRPLPWSVAEVNSQSEGALFFKISAGRDDMPEYGSRVTETEIWELVQYVKSVPRLPGHYNELDPDQSRLNPGPARTARRGSPVTPIPLIGPDR